MNLFDLIQGAANQSGLLPPPQSGRNPGLHPHGSRTRSEIDPLQMILQNKQQTLQNVRSPMVRRSAGGRVVDENEPEGLDWLEANGPERSGQPVHSWDQPKYSPFAGPQQGAPTQPEAQMTQSASGVRAMKGDYGGGFSQGVDAPLVGEFAPPSPYREIAGQPYNPLDPTSEPMMVDEQAANAANIQSAYNETQLNPRQGPAGQQAARSQALARTTDAVKSGMMTPGRGLQGGETNVYGQDAPAEQQGSVTMPTVAPSNPPGVNSYTPFTQSNQDVMANSPLYQGGYFDQADEMSALTEEAVLGDSPGLLPAVGRGAAVTGGALYDMLANMLWRKGPNTTDTQRGVINWLMQNRQPKSGGPRSAGEFSGGLIQ
jgi:hypothetical protein